MDWQRWVDAGILGPAPTGRVRVEPTIRRAWARVGDARDASLSGEWDTADEKLRAAFATAGHALVCYHYLDLYGECDFELAEEFAVGYYGKDFVGPLFARARRLRELMPLPREIPELTARKVRDCIASSSSFVALVECGTYRKEPVQFFSADTPNWYIRQT
ncbi:MAG: hypothetical protein RBS78_03460 [Coriobacteriia bacterium]|jgi:hypothetical protein|nr:hypothetical protein [Coriobacteriia bacterium]